MQRIEYLSKNMSRKQKEVYAKICELKRLHAVGGMLKTCKVLLQFGLITPCSDSDDKNDFELIGEPLQIPASLPLKKDVVIQIHEAPKEEFKHKPTEWVQPISRPAADHTNPSREDYIHKWLTVSVETTGRKMVKVKCLNDGQMEYIVANYENQTAQAMAEHLKVEKYSVNLFCQANDIEPFKPPRKHKPKDDYHIIPPEKLRRMKRADYNGPQKKIA